MKKLIAFIAMIAVFFGIAATSVSAETHEVKKGDNLWGIAKEYDTTIEDLVEINDLKSIIIQPKQKITIKNNIYMVEKGDTLTHIGKEFNVTVDEIKDWNNLKSSLITIGQELEIQGVHVSQEDNVENVKETTKEVPKETKEEASEPASEATESQEVAEPAEKTSKSEEKPKEKSEENPEGETISVTATAYTAKCEGCSGVTSTGVDLNADPNAKVIAVDPSVIPLGSEVYVEGYGHAIAADIGGAIKGNKIDIHVPTKDEAFSWGVKTVNVTIIK